MVPHKTFPGDCGLCHFPDRWDALRDDFEFDHEEETGYALNGAHVRAACLRCHNDRGPVAVYTARGCGGCHPDPHQSTFGIDCTRCHNEVSWRPREDIVSHRSTRFPLLGMHAVTPCEQCHIRAPIANFRGVPVRCDLCHRDDLARATDPDHIANGWTTGCERCHSPVGWHAGDFDSVPGSR